jgi:hypothetical protein
MLKRQPIDFPFAVLAHYSDFTPLCVSGRVRKGKLIGNDGKAVVIGRAGRHRNDSKGLVLRIGKRISDRSD